MTINIHDKTLLMMVVIKNTAKNKDKDKEEIMKRKMDVMMVTKKKEMLEIGMRM
jgi:hypothetical protein